VKLTEAQERELEQLKQTAYFDAMKRKIQAEADAEANKPRMDAGGILNVLGRMGANIRENEKKGRRLW
jgi:hypothetical protein